MPPAASHGRLFHALCSAAIGVLVLAGSAHGQENRETGTVFEVPLPGGIGAALAAVDDRVPADRGQFLLEFIRRTYNAAATVKTNKRDRVLQTLLDHLDAAARQGATATRTPETVPLPLSPALWIEVVFDGRVTADTLVAAILRSRNAALLYTALLSLDDATRAWIAADRRLFSELATQHSAVLLNVAPGLRVRDDAVLLPGGDEARPVWEALVGRAPQKPADFVRALLTRDDGRLAYFFGSIAQLTPAQVRLALNLNSADTAARILAAQRMYAVFVRVANGWTADERAFTRPPLDPALLISELPVDGAGRLQLPGTRQFWAAALQDDRPIRSREGGQDTAAALAAGEPVDIASLCEQVFKGSPLEYRRRYAQVLFASRVVSKITPDTVQDALDAVRAVAAYPALIAVLERSKVADLAAYGAAARRAARLSAIDDDAQTQRALTQFQGMLALLSRAALRGSLSSDALSRLVLSLSAVDHNNRGEYEGRLVRWLDQSLREAPPQAANGAGHAGTENDIFEIVPGTVERDLLRLLAGSFGKTARFVDWEGTRYRVDLARAEGVRLLRLLGDEPRPFLSSAGALVAAADALSAPGLTRERLRQQADAVQQTARALGWDDAGRPATARTAATRNDGAVRRYADAAAALERAAASGDVTAAASLAATLRLLADDLQARGLLELTYATALGHLERAMVTAGDAARRHDFGIHPGRGIPNDMWMLPVQGGDSHRGWRATGSLLGLDVKLAEFSLVRLSSRPPLSRPTLNDEDRRLLTESIALVDSMSLTDSDRDLIASAIRNGRSRLAAARTRSEALALADEIRLDPARLTLFPWVIAHDAGRAAAFLSPSELLWLGLGQAPVASTLHAWGAPAQSRLGCLCLNLADRSRANMFAGRWNSGVFVSGFSDLNLRLAELLADMNMPASLLGPVLASAMLDFINGATSRDPDDRRGLVEFVQALRIDRVEQYLALLTTDGPLVATPDATEGSR